MDVEIDVLHLVNYFDGMIMNEEMFDPIDFFLAPLGDSDNTVIESNVKDENLIHRDDSHYSSDLNGPILPIRELPMQQISPLIPPVKQILILILLILRPIHIQKAHHLIRQSHPVLQDQVHPSVVMVLTH